MKIAIIGAGPAGLIAARNALKLGFETVLFERLERVGGLWNPDSKGVYSNVNMQISRHTFHYANFPSYTGGNFPDVHQVIDYLTLMATATGVLDITNLNTTVTGVVHTQQGWRVSTEQAQQHQRAYFDGVIITTGEQWQARKLAVPGLNDFRGEIVSSQDYWHPEIFTDKNVLVIGDGLSGTDIAADLVPFARSVSLSAKKMGLFLPRYFRLGPHDLMHSYLGRYLLNQLPYDEYLVYLDEALPEYMQLYRESGLLPAMANNTAVLVNEKVIPYIVAGRITLKPQLERINADGKAQFADSSLADYDAIISCIGYERPDYRFITGFDRRRLYEHFFWADNPTLCIISPPIGYVPFGAAFPYFEIISQWILRVIIGKVQLPSLEVMSQWCQENESSLYAKRFYDSWLETIRIGIHAGVLPDPAVNFSRYWNLISSVIKPEFLVSVPVRPVRGMMDSWFNFDAAKVKILASLPMGVRDSLLAKGDISSEEYRDAAKIGANDIIHPELRYSHTYF
ncbi:NAD(P)-binding protein [Yersinia canariae]|uniref:NAD(P)-binding protein n=1 Tax=Yersinia canariae TaxID=2607663 RepID=A0A857F672_9GAMM|nr:FAD-dependent oxidoreductase [Yersinia canariae]QHB34355.1 NAD(P)-binding protein [Yersinia canariae]